MNLCNQHMIWFHVAAAKTSREPWMKNIPQSFIFFLKNNINNNKNNKIKILKEQIG